MPTHPSYGTKEDPTQETTPERGSDRAYHLHRVTSTFKTTISARKAQALARLLSTD
jgi:hypothetical protein